MQKLLHFLYECLAVLQIRSEIRSHSGICSRLSSGVVLGLEYNPEQLQALLTPKTL
jgi:hypothetical protein